MTLPSALHLAHHALNQATNRSVHLDRDALRVLVEAVEERAEARGEAGCDPWTLAPEPPLYAAAPPIVECACPKCGRGLNWTEWTCKVGARTSARCVEVQRAAYDGEPPARCGWTGTVERVDGVNVRVVDDSSPAFPDLSSAIDPDDLPYLPTPQE